MAFILEKISTDKQRAELAALGIASPFTSGPAEVTRWFVDQDRGLHLINLGGGVDRATFLAFADRSGVVLRAHGDRVAKGRFVPGGIDESWKFEEIAIPKTHEGRAEQILALFREALTAYGSHGDPTVTRSVSIDFVPPKFV